MNEAKRNTGVKASSSLLKQPCRKGSEILANYLMQSKRLDMDLHSGMPPSEMCAQFGRTSSIIRACKKEIRLVLHKVSGCSTISL